MSLKGIFVNMKGICIGVYIYSLKESQMNTPYINQRPIMVSWRSVFTQSIHT